MTIDEIKELIQVVRDTGIAELEVQRGEDRVRIKNAAAADKETVMPAVLPVQTGGETAAAAASHAGAVQEITWAASPQLAAPTKADERDIVVKSPIVGTYYDAPSPGLPSFVKTGDRVEPKQVLCIIESMKLMNEIEAEIAGVIVAKHVENGRPVEYGESLFTVRPS
jgi:acetyl-CoA carboxylase biotin carboxyl carrier protein